MMTEDNNYKGDSTNSKKSYPELLKSEHWKNRRQHILLRDGNVCQDCHRRGVHNGSYFRIEEIADLNNFCIGVALYHIVSLQPAGYL